MRELIVSTPSHMRAPMTSRRIMLDVIIALVPASVAAIVFFGFYSLALMAISVASAAVTELVYLFILKHGWRDIKAFFAGFFAQFDFTSVITGLMLALILPPDCPWYLPFFGSIFAIAAVKMLFGGTGKNIVNPAVTGRVFLFMSFAAAMTAYAEPLISFISSDLGGITASPTPLGDIIQGSGSVSLLDLFLGTGIKGCIGETSALAILIGGIYLVVRKVIKWWWPCLYLVSAGLFSVMLCGFDFAVFLPSLLSGGIMFAAVFMATDYSTSPKSPLGKVIYYIALGLLTAGLRKATGIEVASFCIMLMNLIVPFIDTYLLRRPFGYKKNKERQL